MKLEFVYLLLFSIVIFILNLILKKINFLVEKDNKSSHRKMFSSNKEKIQSGGLFLIIILSFTLYDQNINLTISLILIFLLGILSDIEIIRSPKIRFLLQLVIIFYLIITTSLQVEYTKIYLLDYLINYPIISYSFSLFCILILINGCNFIDGANNILLGYFLIISLNVLYLLNDSIIFIDQNLFKIIIISLITLLVFNFFSLIIAGDAGAYVLGLFFSYLLINFSNQNVNISPIYILNLLWYPAFENLFSILRKIRKNTPISSPDNLHLHHLIFKKFFNKNNKNKFNNSITGLFINLFNFTTIAIATLVANHSLYLVIILSFNILVYCSTYYLLSQD